MNPEIGEPLEMVVGSDVTIAPANGEGAGAGQVMSRIGYNATQTVPSAPSRPGLASLVMGNRPTVSPTVG